MGSDTSDSGFDSGFAGGKGYCIDNVGNVTINVTLSCPENCIACDSSCAVCTGGTNNDCSSCNSGFFLQPFSTTCSSNRFTVMIKSYNFHLNHLGCHTSCYTCNGGNSNNCLSCTGSYYFYLSTCINLCPSGYFGNAATHQCDGISLHDICLLIFSEKLACHSTCYTCNGTTENDCVSCSGDRFLYQTTCVTECPNGTWADTSDNTCRRINEELIYPYLFYFLVH